MRLLFFWLVEQYVQKTVQRYHYQSTKPSDEALGQLIYTGPKNREVYLVKYFSLSTSALGVLLQPYILSQMANNGPLVKTSVIAVTGFFVVGTPFLLHFLCKRYAMKMYYNKFTSTFTVVKLNFFARPRYFTFTPDDISETIVDPLANFNAKGQGFLLDTDIIREHHPDAYIVMKKYDKPIDLNKYLVEEQQHKDGNSDDVKMKS